MLPVTFPRYCAWEHILTAGSMCQQLVKRQQIRAMSPDQGLAMGQGELQGQD